MGRLPGGIAGALRAASEGDQCGPTPRALTPVLEARAGGGRLGPTAGSAPHPLRQWKPREAWL